ncbi:hypothetical protein EB796_004588 [Bugula neritina]|uniref:Uncharacterized protein n=1 Tax=Bugula neritina TaxID=10212 RepID=A0A7J7KEM6_BUGNE|nr:hypothetical protein EB796_004588 [Bugula neritina]
MLFPSSTSKLRQILLITFFSLDIVVSTDYYDCIGTSSDCCIKRELYGGDRVILQTKVGNTNGLWCDQVFIVRQSNQQYDDCSGCTFTIEFEETDFVGSLSVREANYTSASYISSETLYLDLLAEYEYPYGRTFPSDELHSTSTVVKFIYDRYSVQSGSLKITVTPNIPQTTVSLVIILSISIPLSFLFILFTVVIYKIRQRKLTQVRTIWNQRVAAVLQDAQLDAQELREARLRQQFRHPQSPEPCDSVAPPSYAEAASPPPYEDVIRSDSSSVLPSDAAPSYDANTDPPLEDSAAPDDGRDSNRLIV